MSKLYTQLSYLRLIAYQITLLSFACLPLYGMVGEGESEGPKTTAPEKEQVLGEGNLTPEQRAAYQEQEGASSSTATAGDQKTSTPVISPETPVTKPPVTETPKQTAPTTGAPASTIEQAPSQAATKQKAPITTKTADQRLVQPILDYIKNRIGGAEKFYKNMDTLSALIGRETKQVLESLSGDAANPQQAEELINSLQKIQDRLKSQQANIKQVRSQTADRDKTKFTQTVNEITSAIKMLTIAQQKYIADQLPSFSKSVSQIIGRISQAITSAQESIKALGDKSARNIEQTKASFQRQIETIRRSLFSLESPLTFAQRTADNISTGSSDLWKSFARTTSGALQTIIINPISRLTKNIKGLLDAAKRAVMGVDPVQEQLEKDLDAISKALNNASLWNGINGDDMQLLLNALKEGANPNTIQNAQGDTPLIVATRAGSSAMVTTLLKNGADPSAKNKAGETALTSAILEDNSGVLEALLQNGAKPNEQNALGFTALALAAGNPILGNKPLLLLLQQGAQPNIPTKTGQTALDFAVSQAMIADDQFNKIITLLQYGAKNAHPKIDGPLASLLARKSRLSTLVDSAILNDVTSLTAQLKSAALDIINKVDQYGLTPLQWAAAQGNTDIVKLLLDAGANPNIKTKPDADNPKGLTAAEIAQRNGYEFETKTTSEEKTGEKQPTASGSGTEEPAKATQDLQAALLRGDVNALSELLKNGANPNQQDVDGNSLLMLAITKQRNYEERNTIISTLLQYKADPNLPNNEGNTPLMMIASEKKSNESLLKLIQAGAKVNAKNNSGATALMRAGQGDPKNLELLLENGADPSLMDKRGRTALSFLKNPADALILLQYGAKISSVSNGFDSEWVKKGILSFPSQPLRDALLLNDVPQLTNLLKTASQNDINYQDAQGFTVLDWAVAQGNVEAVELLLENGADPNIKASTKADAFTGLTAAEIARKNGNKQIFDILTSYMKAPVYQKVLQELGAQHIHFAPELQQQILNLFSSRPDIFKPLPPKESSKGKSGANVTTEEPTASSSGTRVAEKPGITPSSGLTASAVKSLIERAQSNSSGTFNELSAAGYFDDTQKLNRLFTDIQSNAPADVPLFIQNIMIGSARQADYKAIDMINRWAQESWYETAGKLNQQAYRDAQDLITDGTLGTLEQLTQTTTKETAPVDAQKRRDLMKFLEQILNSPDFFIPSPLFMHGKSAKTQETNLKLRQAAEARIFPNITAQVLTRLSKKYSSLNNVLAKIPANVTESNKMVQNKDPRGSVYQTERALLEKATDKPLDRDQDVNAIDQFGRTALHWAAERGDTALVKVLLDYGANFAAITPTGETALTLAEKNNRTDAVKALQEYSAQYKG